MKKLLLMLTISAASMVGFAQGTTTTATPPKPAGGAAIAFTSEDVDYGTIENGSNGEREFKFKNTGTEALVITTCRGSCGCTVPKCPTEPILPGQNGVIKVHYDTNRTGAFTKTVTVDSNDPSGTKVLRIHGEVKPPATPNPAVTPAPAPGGH